MDDKKVNKLTAKMMLFCENLANGNSQRESYNLAYPNLKRSDVNTDSAASRLLSIIKVFDYYQSLLKQSAENAQITRGDILEKYKEIFNSSPDGMIVKNSDRLKALELTAKMLGFNEPDKLEINKTESIIWNEERTYEAVNKTD
jgi:PAS domain-containing protein